MSFVIDGGHVLLQPLCGGAKQRKKRFIREMFDAFFSFISPLLKGIQYLSKPAIRRVRSMVLDGLEKGGLLEHDHTMASVRMALLHVASELLGKEVSGDISWLAKQISSLVHSAIEYVSYSDEKSIYDVNYDIPFHEQFAKSEIRVEHFQGNNEGGATLKVIIGQPVHNFDKLLAAFLKQVEDYVAQTDVSIEVHIPPELRIKRFNRKENNEDKFINYMRMHDFDSIWWLCSLDVDSAGLRSSSLLYYFMDVASFHRKSEPKPAPNPVVVLCTEAEFNRAKDHIESAYGHLGLDRERPLICNAKVLVCLKFPDPTGKSGLSVKTLLEESKKPNPMTPNGHCGRG